MSLFYDKSLCIQCSHKRLICRAGYRAGLADRVVADDICEAGRVLVHGRRIYESLDGLYQRLASLAGYVEDSLHQEAAELIKRIQEQITAGIDPREICVVARTNALIDDYKKYLTAAGIDSFEIKRKQADDRSRIGVRLATMHRVKGLEFTTVFIVAANKNFIPLKSAVNRTDPAERDAAMASERCLLYVAMTRAKKKVMISAYGAVSEFLG